MFTKDRRIQICKQIYIKEMFIKFHEEELYINNRKITNQKQALAIALSISNKQCNDLDPIKKKYMKKLKSKDLLKILKLKELKNLVKKDKRINVTELNKLNNKDAIYKKYLNREKLFNKLFYYLSKNK